MTDWNGRIEQGVVYRLRSGDKFECRDVDERRKKHFQAAGTVRQLSVGDAFLVHNCALDGRHFTSEVLDVVGLWQERPAEPPPCYQGRTRDGGKLTVDNIELCDVPSNRVRWKFDNGNKWHTAVDGQSYQGHVSNHDIVSQWPHTEEERRDPQVGSIGRTVGGHWVRCFYSGVNIASWRHISRGYSDLVFTTDLFGVFQKENDEHYVLGPWNKPKPPEPVAVDWAKPIEVRHINGGNARPAELLSDDFRSASCPSAVMLVRVREHSHDSVFCFRQDGTSDAYRVRNAPEPATSPKPEALTWHAGAVYEDRLGRRYHCEYVMDDAVESRAPVVLMRADGNRRVRHRDGRCYHDKDSDGDIIIRVK